LLGQDIFKLAKTVGHFVSLKYTLRLQMLALMKINAKWLLWNFQKSWFTNDISQGAKKVKFLHKIAGPTH